MKSKESVSDVRAVIVSYRTSSDWMGTRGKGKWD